MTRTIFYRTLDDRYVEVNALTSTPQRIIAESELPPDCKHSDRQIAFYKAEKFAVENGTKLIGIELASDFMRNTENVFVNPEAL